jgi:hypothetical protein
MAKSLLVLASVSLASAFQGSPIAGRHLTSYRVQPTIQTDLRTERLSLWTTSKAVEDGDEDMKSIKAGLTKEFFSIGLPAFVQLAAEPLAALVDTAYLGRLGPEVLGGAGVAISAQYAVSKVRVHTKLLGRT